MSKSLKIFIIISLLSVIPTALVWTPFFLNLRSFWGIPLPQNGMATIVSNYDGPLYIIVAKTLYNLTEIKSSFQFPIPIEYYAAHFPLFPLLIKLFSLILGNIYSMLLVTTASSILCQLFFFKLASLRLDEKKALILTAIFAVFPARWLIVRSVGSPEPLFLAGIIASVYYFLTNKFMLSGIWGMVAAMTKSPGILLFPAYILTVMGPSIKNFATENLKLSLRNLNLKKFAPLLLIPLGTILVFSLYAITFGDFFAYFNSGDNIHIFFPPFSVFNYSAPWVGTFWLEEIIFIYFLGAISLMKLAKDKRGPVYWFFMIFFVSILFVAHRDVLRYALPLVPFALLAFAKTLTRKKFVYIFLLIAVPTFLFAIAFISQNAMPISNWEPFLK